MKQNLFVKRAILYSMSLGLTDAALNSASVDTITDGLISGECEHSSGPFDDEKKARSYAKSLVGNYMKKDKDLNGGIKYVPANPRGPIVKDEQLKELKGCLKALEANKINDPGLIGQVNERIAAREAELETQKTTSKLPGLEETMAKLAILGINTQSDVA